MQAIILPSCDPDQDCYMTSLRRDEFTSRVYGISDFVATFDLYAYTVCL